MPEMRRKQQVRFPPSCRETDKELQACAGVKFPSWGFAGTMEPSFQGGHLCPLTEALGRHIGRAF
ncbi:hypothetical protein AD940_02565 [Gluconobacter thailandicus]|nr:hypothetical protein AD940_02565 [Gluconobacter thailandicus]